MDAGFTSWLPNGSHLGLKYFTKTSVKHRNWRPKVNKMNSEALKWTRIISYWKKVQFCSLKTGTIHAHTTQWFSSHFPNLLTNVCSKTEIKSRVYYSSLRKEEFRSEVCQFMPFVWRNNDCTTAFVNKRNYFQKRIVKSPLLLYLNCVQCSVCFKTIPGQHFYKSSTLF